MMFRMRLRIMPPAGGGGKYIWYSPRVIAHASVTVALYDAKSCTVSVPPEKNTERNGGTQQN